LEKRLRKRWFRKRMITLSFLLPILGVGTWAAIHYKPWVKSGTTVAAVNSAAKKEKTKPAVVTPNSRGEQRSPLPASEQKPRQAEIPRPKIREEPAVLPSPDRFQKSSPREIKRGKQEDPPAIQKKGTPSQPPGNSEFKLDALVWSSNPKSRFAVINGQIVRAGETIKGASITEIQRDYVALKSGNTTWELRLDIHPKFP
jgi:hypothetical protein